METIKDLINKIIGQLVNPLIALLFGIALLYFLWGIVQYVIGSQGDEKKLAQGRQAMIWGIVGLVIMLSAWGIVKAICLFFFKTCP